MILLIDNYDSFTYNLYQYLCELGAEVTALRNDRLTLEDVEAMSPTGIVISPGPCTPKEAGISNDIVRRFGPRVPTLGVCLGHQCIGDAYGGRVDPAGEIMHGKTSLVYHDGKGGVPRPAQPLRGHPIPLPGRLSRWPARLTGSKCLDRQRDNHGPAPQGAPSRGSAVPPRVHNDAPGQAAAEELAE